MTPRHHTRPTGPATTAGSRRSGYTLLELMIASVASLFLIVGLASAMLIAGATANDPSAAGKNTDAAAAMDRVVTDLRNAKSFTERTATAVTFKVPDRDGNETDDTIRYFWSGTAGSDLTMAFNGGAPRTVAKNVQQFNLAWLTQPVVGTGFAKGVLGVTYEEFTETKSSASSAILTKPPGTADGQLLIAVVVKNDADGNITPPSGWTQISLQQNGDITMGVWWKIAGASEPASYSFNLSSGTSSYSWMMRFTGQNPSNPIHVVAQKVGSSKSKRPRAPSVNTTIADAVILRIGGFDHQSITIDDTGLSGHTTITMDNNGISGGAGYTLQPAAGATGTANFQLTSKETYITVTVAIVP